MLTTENDIQSSSEYLVCYKRAVIFMFSFVVSYQLQQLFVKTVKNIEQQVKSDSMNRRLTNHLTYVNFS